MVVDSASEFSWRMNQDERPSSLNVGRAKLDNLSNLKKKKKFLLKNGTKIRCPKINISKVEY